jgi:hypothetical protein
LLLRLFGELSAVSAARFGAIGSLGAGHGSSVGWDGSARDADRVGRRRGIARHRSGFDGVHRRLMSK